MLYNEYGMIDLNEYGGTGDLAIIITVVFCGFFFSIFIPCNVVTLIISLPVTRAVDILYSCNFNNSKFQMSKVNEKFLIFELL